MNSDFTRALLAAMPLPLVLIGPDARIKAVNPPGSGVVGPGAEGRHYMHVLRAPPLLDCIETAFRSGKAAQGRHLPRPGARDIPGRLQADRLGGGGAGRFWVECPLVEVGSGVQWCAAVRSGV